MDIKLVLDDEDKSPINDRISFPTTAAQKKELDDLKKIDKKIAKAINKALREVTDQILDEVKRQTQAG